MKNQFIISLLFLSVGFSQKLIEIIETYDNGNIESITYHKKTRDKIEKVKDVKYYENGQKKKEQPYKDGKRDGVVTLWYENGQKQGEGTFKDDKYDGLYTEWYENGQKRFEGTYKDRLLINIKGRWNKNGSVRKKPFGWE
jgi:antitoxin component YwqK of YwqJK toxin-antitoxin module